MKRVVFIEEGAFWGIISVLLITIGWFMGILGDHGCESTFFLANCWASSRVMCVKRVYFGKP